MCNLRIIFLFLISTSLFFGCGYKKALEPAAPAGFVDRKHSNLASDRAPFQYVWRKDANDSRVEIYKRGSYKIYVAPVTTRFLKFDGKDSDLKEKADEIARYLGDRINTEIAKREGKSIKAYPVKSREDADMYLEIALTEIGLGNPILYTGAWLLPLPGTGTAVDSMQQPVLAFEGRFTAAKTNEIIAEAADRKIPPVRILDLNKVTSKMGPLREISNNWAIEIANSVQAKLDEEAVSRTAAFTVLPW